MAEWPILLNLCEGAKAHAQGKTVTVILQIHRSFHESPKELEDVIDCQKKIFEILEAEQHDVLGTEGHDLDPYTITSYAEACANEGMRDENGNKFPLDALIETLKSRKDDEAALAYTIAHPTGAIIGVEDRPLNDLNMSFINQSGVIAHHLGREWTFRVGDLIRRARSEIALAKVIEKLHRLKKRRGVIVIGYAHEPEYKELAEKYGITVEVKDAVPPTVQK